MGKVDRLAGKLVGVCGGADWLRAPPDRPCVMCATLAAAVIWRRGAGAQNFTFEFQN